MIDSAGEELDDDEDDDEDEEEDEENDNDDEVSRNNNNVNMHRPFMQSSSSLSGPNAFAPPFYNRPPTPLPPSLSPVSWAMYPHTSRPWGCNAVSAGEAWPRKLPCADQEWLKSRKAV